VSYSRCFIDHANGDFSRERREHRVFDKLLQMVPGLEERLLTGSEEEITFVAELVSLRSSFTINLFFMGVLDTERGFQRKS
jgi:hypothetical protein